MKLNKTGTSFADIIVGSFLLLLSLGVLLQFNGFHGRTKELQEINSIAFNVLHNESTSAYAVDNWANLLGESTFDSSRGPGAIIFKDYRNTIFDTEYIYLEVSLQEKTVGVGLERRSK